MIVRLACWLVLLPSIVHGADSPGALSPTNHIKLFNGENLTASTRGLWTRSEKIRGMFLQ